MFCYRINRKNIGTVEIIQHGYFQKNVGNIRVSRSIFKNNRLSASSWE